jgi:hypothetical protein
MHLLPWTESTTVSDTLDLGLTRPAPFRDDIDVHKTENVGGPKHLFPSLPPSRGPPVRPGIAASRLYAGDRAQGKGLRGGRNGCSPAREEGSGPSRADLRPSLRGSDPAL